MLIGEVAVDWHAGTASHQEVDRLGIVVATFLAMRRALEGLSVPVDEVLVDGPLAIPGIRVPQQAIVGGDLRCRAVSAASVIAKVTRDRLMVELDAQFPAYGFAAHKGYATPQHLAALRANGPCPEHRLRFAPVRLAATPRLPVLKD